MLAKKLLNIAKMYLKVKVNPENCYVSRINIRKVDSPESIRNFTVTNFTGQKKKKNKEKVETSPISVSGTVSD